MTILLAFDTAAHHCAAALLCGDRMTWQVEPMAQGQAERLFPLLEQLLAEAGLTWAALDGIGVGTGPGNFTGIRIAVAAARGLALGLGIPAIGVTGFEAAAHGLPRPLTVVLPAPRGQMYRQRLTAAADLPPELVDAIAHATDPAPALVPATVPDFMPDPVPDPTPNLAPRSAPRSAPDLAPDLAPDPAADLAPDPAADLAPDPAAMIAAIARIAASRLGTPQPRPAPCYAREPDAAPPRDPAPVLLP